MTTFIRLCVLVGALTCGNDAIADSYPGFVDTLEVDRHQLVFALARKILTNPADKGISIIVWTRLDPAALGKFQRRELFPLTPNVDLRLTPGPVRTVCERTCDRHPTLIRVGNSSLVIADFLGNNYADLQHRPAVQILNFDGEREHLLKLESIFANATERYHNGRGRVSWLYNAWIDEEDRRLFLVSTRHHTNTFGYEVAMVDLDTGKVTSAGEPIIKQQLSRIEGRFLYCILDVAIHYKIDGINDFAMRVYSDQTIPLPARVRAAAHLSTLGNSEAARLIQELSALARTDPADVRHPSVSRVLVFEDDYWWNSIGYAARALDQLSERESGK